jgi:hypothetical protein
MKKNIQHSTFNIQRRRLGCAGIRSYDLRESQPCQIVAARKRFSLSSGERAGVRVSVSRQLLAAIVQRWTLDVGR